MNKPKVAPFPPRRQREAWHRAKRGPFRPVAADSPSADGIRWPAFVAITLAMCTALFLAIFLGGGAATVTAATGAEQHDGRFGICAGPDRFSCVVDGDTLWFEGRKIRIADINTPEISSPGCASEAALGEKAKFRLQALLNQGRFSLRSIDRDQDRYGRDLRIITRGGESLGEILVTEGLAERWQGHRRNWC
ncbi:thermonuclease family protein [Parasphingorhabdus sp.]|uniref:thermonuclease family protein n=1 Tax=Parasphingorhabdus sp. TaxID=2709688 RepID=UPI003002F1E6